MLSGRVLQSAVIKSGALSYARMRTGLLFKKGEILRKVPEEELLPALLEEVAKL